MGTFARHGKSIYRGGHLKTSASENRYFSRRARHGKSISRDGHIIRPATVKVEAQYTTSKAQFRAQVYILAFSFRFPPSLHPPHRTASRAHSAAGQPPTPLVAPSSTLSPSSTCSPAISSAPRPSHRLPRALPTRPARGGHRSTGSRRDARGLPSRHRAHERGPPGGRPAAPTVDQVAVRGTSIRGGAEDFDLRAVAAEVGEFITLFLSPSPSLLPLTSLQG